MTHRNKLLFIFQFYDCEKNADLILFDIPENNYVQAYMRMHSLHFTTEELRYKRFKDFDVDVAKFSIHCVNYVFMIITLPKYRGHTYESFCKSINVQNLAYNMLWDVEEV